MLSQLTIRPLCRDCSRLTPLIKHSGAYIYGLIILSIVLYLQLLLEIHIDNPQKDIKTFHLTKVYKSYDHFRVFQTAAKSRFNPTAPVIGANVECDLSGCRTGQNGFHRIGPCKKTKGWNSMYFDSKVSVLGFICVG